MDKLPIYDWCACIKQDTKRVIINTLNSNVCVYEDQAKAMQAGQHIADQTGESVEIVQMKLVHYEHYQELEKEIEELKRINLRMQKIMAHGFGKEKEDTDESKSGN